MYQKALEIHAFQSTEQNTLIYHDLGYILCTLNDLVGAKETYQADAFQKKDINGLKMQISGILFDLGE
jgi:hypothetical protein